MGKNVGGIDRIIRIVSGALLVAWAAVLGGPIWAWIGIVPLATGALGFCPIYTLINMSTCSRCKSDDK